MGLGYKRTFGSGSIPVYQGTGKDIQLAQGGFLLDSNGLNPGDLIKAGTPMIYNETNRTAKPLTTGVIYEQAAADALTYKIHKLARFKKGDNFAAKSGGKAYPITKIDTKNTAYDLVNVSTTIGALQAGDLVFASHATGATHASFDNVNGLLYSDVIVNSKESVSVVIRATVYARRVPYSADLATALPHIIYSQSY